MGDTRERLLFCRSAAVKAFFAAVVERREVNSPLALPNYLSKSQAKSCTQDDVVLLDAHLSDKLSPQ